MLVYAFLSWLVIDNGAPLRGDIFGHDADSYAFLWFIEWYPYAITHHLDPLVTHLVWQPAGLALLWMSSVPILAVLAAPITLWLGPIPVYNCLVLTGPVLSAWCMYRLCLQICREPKAALISGFCYGFSTYEMAQVSTLNLSYTFLLPCLGLVLVGRMKGHIGRGAHVALLSILGICQFLISIEIFAITALFGAIFGMLAYVIIPDWRRGLNQCVVDALFAGVIVLVVLSPLLTSMFAQNPYIHLPKLWPYYFSATPTGFFVPGQNTLLSFPPAYRLIKVFKNDVEEQTTYLGLPLLAILYLYGRGSRGCRLTRLLTVMILLLLILSLGPHLWLGENYTMIRLPWAAFMRLPLLENALPIRFALFVSFFAAIILTLWLSGSVNVSAQRRRLSVAILACFVFFPTLHGQMRMPMSTFFAPGREQAVLGMDKQLLILPFWVRGPSSFWQLENGFGFRQSGGYLGYPPLSMQHFQAVWELGVLDPAKIIPADVADFAETTKANYIVAGPGTPEAEVAVIETLHWRERKIDDVTIFDVPTGGTGG